MHNVALGTELLLGSEELPQALREVVQVMFSVDYVYLCHQRLVSDEEDRLQRLIPGTHHH